MSVHHVQNTYLQLAFYDNASIEDYKSILNHLGVDEINVTNKEALLEIFGLDLYNDKSKY